MGVFSAPPKICSVCCLSAALLLATACGNACGQSLRFPAQRKFDEIGYEYRDVFVDGLWQRAYHEPIRQVVAWEVCRRLPEIGLPGLSDNRPSCGHDALGRPWRRDVLGYAYYEEIACHGGVQRHYYQPERRSVAARVRAQLDCVDWQGAVRGGVTHAAVRGFNGVGGSEAADGTLVRSVVRERIVEGLNLAGIGYGAHDLPRFQDLVAAGVEDAVVEAFNRLDVIDDKPWELVPPESQGHEPVPAEPPQVGQTGIEEESVLPAHVPVLVPQERRVRPVADIRVRAGNGTGSEGDVARSHYGGPLRGAAFSERYEDALLTDSGWCVDSSGIRPLTGKGFLILSIKGEPKRDEVKRVDVWQDQMLIYRNCYYAEFFEDARRISSRGS